VEVHSYVFDHLHPPYVCDFPTYIKGPAFTLAHIDVFIPYPAILYWRPAVFEIDFYLKLCPRLLAHSFYTCMDRFVFGPVFMEWERE